MLFYALRSFFVSKSCTLVHELECAYGCTLAHRYHTEGIGNGSRAAIHCIILASGRQCRINQHLSSDHVIGTFSKSKDI